MTTSNHDSSVTISELLGANYADVPSVSNIPWMPMGAVMFDGMTWQDPHCIRKRRRTDSGEIERWRLAGVTHVALYSDRYPIAPWGDRVKQSRNAYPIRYSPLCLQRFAS